MDPRAVADAAANRVIVTVELDGLPPTPNIVSGWVVSDLKSTNIDDLSVA